MWKGGGGKRTIRPFDQGFRRIHSLSNCNVSDRTDRVAGGVAYVCNSSDGCDLADAWRNDPTAPSGSGVLPRFGIE